MLKEFKNIKIAKQPKSQVKIEEDGAAQNSDEEMYNDMALGRQPDTVTNPANQAEATKAAAESAKKETKDSLLGGKGPRSLCKVPIIKEQPLHQKLFDVAAKMKKPALQITL